MNTKAATVILVLALLLIGAFWQPHNPDAIDLGHRHAALSWSHPLGTDNLGRDVLSRIMVGGWRSIVVLLIVGAIGLIGGCSIGVGAAMMSGWQQAILLRAAEVSIIMPTLVVALTVTALFGMTPVVAGLALGFAGIGPQTLLAHSLAQRVLAQPYVLSARALGVTGSRLVVRHVLPNIAPVLLTHVGSNAGRTIVAYASLAFLGLGADPSRPDWGAMLFEYRGFLFDDPALMIWPGLPIAVVALVLNRVFDPGEEQALDERSSIGWDRARLL